MDAKKIILTTLTVLLWTQPAVAQNLVPACRGINTAMKRVRTEAHKKDSDPAAQKGLNDKLQTLLMSCVADKDNDGEVDLVESRDDEADALRDKWKKLRKDTAKRYAFSSSVTKTIQYKKSMGGSNTDSASKSWVKIAGCPSDDAGHILANKLGGSGKAADRNIFPQNQSINRGAYRVFEKKIHEKLAELSKSQCRTKTMTLKWTFSGFGGAVRPQRPTSVVYKVKFLDPEDNCKSEEWSKPFDNDPGPNCKED